MGFSSHVGTNGPTKWVGLLYYSSCKLPIVDHFPRETMREVDHFGPYPNNAELGFINPCVYRYCLKSQKYSGTFWPMTPNLFNQGLDNHQTIIPQETHINFHIGIVAWLIRLIITLPTSSTAQRVAEVSDIEYGRVWLL